MIRTSPSFTQDINTQITISYWNGIIFYENYWHVYIDGRLLCIDDGATLTIQEYNSYKLCTRGGLNSLRNFKSNPILMPYGYAPYIFEREYQLYAVICNTLYKYNNEWESICEYDYATHIVTNFFYIKQNNMITINDLSHNVIGHIKLPSTKFGFGANYFVMYDNNMLKIWILPI